MLTQQGHADASLLANVVTLAGSVVGFEGCPAEEYWLRSCHSKLQYNHATNPQLQAPESPVTSVTSSSASEGSGEACCIAWPSSCTSFSALEPPRLNN